MTAEEKQATRREERAADAAAVAARVDLIASREYDRRGGYERIAPPDFSASGGYLAGTEPEEQARLLAGWKEHVAAADEVCMSTR